MTVQFQNVTISPESEPEQCGICLGDCQINESLVAHREVGTLGDRTIHIHHEGCIRDYLDIGANQKCPKCNLPIRGGILETAVHIGQGEPTPGAGAAPAQADAANRAQSVAARSFEAFFCLEGAPTPRPQPAPVRAFHQRRPIGGLFARDFNREVVGELRPLFGGIGGFPEWVAPPPPAPDRARQRTCQPLLERIQNTWNSVRNWDHWKEAGLVIGVVIASTYSPLDTLSAFAVAAAAKRALSHYSNRAQADRANPIKVSALSLATVGTAGALSFFTRSWAPAAIGLAAVTAGLQQCKLSVGDNGAFLRSTLSAAALNAFANHLSPISSFTTCAVVGAVKTFFTTRRNEPILLKTAKAAIGAAATSALGFAGRFGLAGAYLIPPRWLKVFSERVVQLHN